MRYFAARSVCSNRYFAERSRSDKCVKEAIKKEEEEAEEERVGAVAKGGENWMHRLIIGNILYSNLLLYLLL